MCGCHEREYVRAHLPSIVRRELKKTGEVDQRLR